MDNHMAPHRRTIVSPSAATSCLYTPIAVPLSVRPAAAFPVYFSFDALSPCPELPHPNCHPDRNYIPPAACAVRFLTYQVPRTALHSLHRGGFPENHKVPSGC